MRGWFLLANALVLGEGEGEDADANTWGLLQLLATGTHGGTGGHYVVDEENVFVAQGFAIDELKGSLNVELALQHALASLTLHEVCACDDFAEDWNTRDGTNAFGDELALVVAALPLSFAGDRHGQKGIDALKEIGGSEFLCCEPP